MIRSVDLNYDIHWWEQGGQFCDALLLDLEARDQREVDEPQEDGEADGGDQRKGGQTTPLSLKVGENLTKCQNSKNPIKSTVLDTVIVTYCNGVVIFAVADEHKGDQYKGGEQQAQHQQVHQWPVPVPTQVVEQEDLGKGVDESVGRGERWRRVKG